MTVECPRCSASLELPQPYPYHAGFGDTAFLYNESGDHTLVWGVYDEVYGQLLGAEGNPWTPTPAVQGHLEAALPPSPAGDRWGFDNPARCLRCRGELHRAIGRRSLRLSPNEALQPTGELRKLAPLASYWIARS